MRDYVPARDADLLPFSANFSGLITASPTDYGLVAGDATDVASAHTAYDTALTAATDPTTRTAATVAAKDAARTALEFQIRSKAALVQAFPSITSTLLTGLGLTVRDPSPTVIPTPSSQPVATVDSIATGRHTLRIVDSLTPASRSKPDGSKWCHVYCKRGSPAPAGKADCVYVGAATRFLFDVAHSNGDAGKQAYYLTAWVNARGEEGPLSNLVSATIAA